MILLSNVSYDIETTFALVSFTIIKLNLYQTILSEGK